MLPVDTRALLRCHEVVGGRGSGAQPPMEAEGRQLSREPLGSSGSSP